jgi:hypothetical protein
MSEMDHDDNY